MILYKRTSKKRCCQELSIYRKLCDKLMYISNRFFTSQGWVSRTGAREEVARYTRQPLPLRDGFPLLLLEERWPDWKYKATFTSPGWVSRTGARGEVARYTRQPLPLWDGFPELVLEKRWLDIQGNL